MAGTIKLEQLFLDKFVEYNKTRYADDPVMLPLFKNLTLDEIVISDLDSSGPVIQSATVSSANRNFRGIEQSWTPADLNSVNAFTLVNPGAPLTSFAEVGKQTVAGVYAYTSGSDVFPALALPADTTPENREAAVRALFQSSYKYIITDAELTVSELNVSVTTNSYTRGTVLHTLSKAPVMAIPETDYGQLVYPEPAE